MRQPNVENKYNLSRADLTRLKVHSREHSCSALFYRNEAIKAWVIAKTIRSNSYMIILYDTTDVQVKFNSHFDMCNYNFTQFFDYTEIEILDDLEIQESALSTLNELLDKGVLKLVA